MSVRGFLGSSVASADPPRGSLAQHLYAARRVSAIRSSLPIRRRAPGDAKVSTLSICSSRPDVHAGQLAVLRWTELRAVQTYGAASRWLQTQYPPPSWGSRPFLKHVSRLRAAGFHVGRTSARRLHPPPTGEVRISPQAHRCYWSRSGPDHRARHRRAWRQRSGHARTASSGMFQKPPGISPRGLRKKRA